MALRWRGCSGNGHRRGVGRKYQSGIFPFPTQSGKPQDKADEGRSTAIPPPRRQMTPNDLLTGKFGTVPKLVDLTNGEYSLEVKRSNALPPVACPPAGKTPPPQGGGVSVAGFCPHAQGHKRGIPRGTVLWLPGGLTCEEMGGDLLSRLSRQYHRRGRA